MISVFAATLICTFGAAGLPQATHEPAPLSPEQSLGRIHLAPGFQVKLAASEPLIADPVAIDWDAVGRLWVVEMADYPLGMDGKGKPGGRVRVLEDADGDGQYDKSTIFAKGLSFPTGVLTWRDGVIVTAAPDILFLKDSDGDGRADVRQVLFTGFLEGNQQLRINGLRWGLDNWVYCAAGGHHRGYATGTKIKSMRRGEEIALGGRDFRFKPDTGEFDPQSGPAQFGRNRDIWGRWFGTQNSNPLWHYVLADHYIRRNPYVPAPDPTRQIFVPTNPKVFPRSSAEKRFHSFEHEGHFTSACAGMIFGDTLLFGNGGTHAFVCEPFHNLVQHQLLDEDGVSFKARRASGEESRDFFVSEDRWCRPVMTRTGPDGALWVVDMYRLMIEHPDWLPEKGRAELLPIYRKGDDRGRIYRVLPNGKVAPKWKPLDRMTNGELVKVFESENSWLRDKAQQILLWRGDKTTAPDLEKMTRDSTQATGRLHALCTLGGLGMLRPELVIAALRDGEAGVRENALRLAEQFQSEPVINASIPLVDDPSAKVRLQLACTLGQWGSKGAGEALARLASRDVSDDFIPTAVMSSAIPHLDTLASMAKRDRFLEPIILTALGQERLEIVRRMIAPALLSDHGEFQEAQLRDFSTILKILNNRKLDATPFGDATALLTFAEHKLQASDAPLRMAAASVLVREESRRESTMHVLSKWMGTEHSPEAQQHAIQLLGETGATNVAALLLGDWASHSPRARSLILQVLLRREPWVFELLDRVANGEIALSALDPATRAQVRQHSARRVRELAEQVFSAKTPRAEAVQRFQPALTLKGTPARGGEIYQQLCQSCHQRDGQGGDVGPDLKSVASHPPEKLLVNILDPNADVQPGFYAYTCVLKNGEELYGVITSETANSLVLKLANASAQTISRQDIATLRASNFSLMPEGLENELTPQQLADLIAFLRNEKSEIP